MGQMLKKTPKIEYMFSSCILNLSKKEYTTFFQKFSIGLRRHRVWVRATSFRNHRPASKNGFSVEKTPKDEYMSSS